MPKAILSRRNLARVGVALSVAFLDRRRSFLRTSGGHAERLARYEALALVCSNLRCSCALGEACRRALPPHEISLATVRRLLLMDEPLTYTSVGALRGSLRKRARDDFLAGRVLLVDGWMLALTEVRLYALAASLSDAAPPDAA